MAALYYGITRNIVEWDICFRDDLEGSSRGWIVFLTVLRYIFEINEGGLVAKIEDYLWTNYSHYIAGSGWTDISFPLSIFHRDKKTAIRLFIDYVNIDNSDVCLELSDKSRLNDGEAIKIIKEYCNLEDERELSKLEKYQRNQFIKELRENHSLSVRQIERITGVSRGIVQRI